MIYNKWDIRNTTNCSTSHIGRIANHRFSEKIQTEIKVRSWNGSQGFSENVDDNFVVGEVRIELVPKVDECVSEGKK